MIPNIISNITSNILSRYVGEGRWCMAETQV